MQSELNIEDYLAEFRKRFSSFQKRAPISLSFKITPLKIYLKDETNDSMYTFEITYKQSVRELIGDIRSFLMDNAYPILIKTEYELVDPDTKELNAYMEKHDVSFDQAFKHLNRRERIKEYTVEKVNFKKNQIILEDEAGRKLIYCMKMPVILFLKNYLRGSYNPRESFLKFQEDSDLLYTQEKYSEEEKVDI
jgi:hypothetical protein